MRRIFMIVLVCGLICLLGTTVGLAQKVYPTLDEYETLTGKKIEKFNEAPILKTKVAAGELPPVEERLPEEPFVVEPLEEIGRYGGILNGIATAPMTWEDPMQVRRQFIVDKSIESGELIPSIFKDLEFSRDQKTLTIHFRKGMKWSDGAPFTADDCIFWYEDMLQNKELTPVISTTWMPGGKLIEMKKLDDYTIRLNFAVPYPILLSKFWSGTMFFAPKHYVKKWHIRYNPKADELAKKEGYDHWWETFGFHNDKWNAQQDANLPTLRPWILKERTPTQGIFERNPYYYKVDTLGNQLPYIDELVSNIAGDIETANLKVMSGEIDFAGMPLTMENYSLYKGSEERGNYRILLWTSTRGSECSFAFNLNHDNPVLRRIFQDVRFRRAMSLAIYRDEINEAVFLGRGIPRQATVLPTCSYYEKEWGTAYAQYDPERANELLDEMGLEWDRDHKWRLRPDGKTLAITIEYWAGEGPKTAICELVRDYWNIVGVKTEIKSEERSFYQTRALGGKIDVGVWHTDRTTEDYAYATEACRWFNPAAANEMGGWVHWATWLKTNGKEGKEPPENVKQLYRWIKDWQIASTKEEYSQLAKKIFGFHAENAWVIGTVGMVKLPTEISNNLKNVPSQAYFGQGVNFWLPTQPAQWFFKR